MPTTYLSPPSVLYVHIPHIKQERLKNLYFEHLNREITVNSPSNSDYQIDAVYLSCQGMHAFDPRVLDTFGTLKNRFPINNGTEVTIEVGIDNVKPIHAILWRKAGVNRVSLRLGSQVAMSQLEYAMRCCTYFFQNNTVDIHINFYSKALLEWVSSFSRISLDTVKHISLYIGELRQKQAAYDLYVAIQDICRANTLLPYESFHFAREGYESRYMKALWSRKSHRGFGTGAESFDGVRRTKNKNNVRAYIHAIATYASACDTSEVLTEGQVFLEHLMLGIRRPEGINIDHLIEKKSISYQQEMRERIGHLVNQGYIVYHQGVVRLQPKGYSVERGVLLYLAL